MTPQRRKNTYKLSPVQEGMLFQELDAKRSGINIGQIVCSIDEPIDVELLKSAWRRVADRHEALRTSFHLRQGEEPHQNVHREVALPWNAKDLRALPGALQESELNRWLREDREAGFELDHDPLFRLNLFRLGDEKWTLVWTFHQGILDTRSFPVVLTEVFRTYDAARRSETLELPEVRPYADYLQFLHSLENGQAERFWRNTLRGFTNATPLASLESHGGGEGFAEEELQLSTTVTQAIAELAIRERFTVNNAVQAAWAAMLGRYNDAADVVFGAMRPCRGFLPRAGSMVGAFSNTLPVRVKLPGDLSVLDLLRHIRANEIAVRDFEHTSLGRIESWSELPPTSPLFDSVLIFDQAPLNAQMKSPYSNWTHRNVCLLEHSNCPLALYAYAEPKLTLRIAYDRRRFGQANISQALADLQIILQDIATGSDKQVSELLSLIEGRIYPKAGLCARPRIEQVIVPSTAPVPALAPAAENLTPAKATPFLVKPGIDSTLADHTLWSLLAEKLSPASEPITELIEEQERTYPKAGPCAPRKIEQVVVPIAAPVPAQIPVPEDMRAAQASASPVRPGFDSALADHTLWTLLSEKLPRVNKKTRKQIEEQDRTCPNTGSGAVPQIEQVVVPAKEDLTPAEATAPLAKTEIDNLPADRELWNFLGEVLPRVDVSNAPVPVDAVSPKSVLKVELSRPSVEHSRASEPFAWATEQPKKAKRKARSEVRSRPELHTILRGFLKSAKDAAHTTVAAANRLGLGSEQPADKLEVSRTLRDSRLQGEHSGIVTIQPNGTKPPIFCISALDGDLTLFRTLSAGLGNDQPVYALDPSGIMNNPAVIANVKKIARFYINQLHAAGEDRPYCLLGSSFGGLVALEMSQQLRAAGAEVPATVLIDTHYPAGCRTYEKLGDRMHRYKDHLLKRDSLQSSTHGPAGSSEVTPEIVKIQERAADRYRTRPYPGRACVLKAATPLDLFDGGPKIGWDRIFNDNISIYYDIPGDGGVINTSKHAGLMVRRLREFLGGVEEARVLPALSRIAS